MTGYDDPGAQLRALRQQLGWSQEELANRAGLSTGVIKKIEGGGTARMETLRALARALGVHTVWFVRPGSPAPTVDNGNDAVLADMRAAILPPVGLDGRPLGTADHDDVHLPRLADAATEANHIYHADRYDDLARLLPGLIQSAHYHVSALDGPDHQRARRVRSALLGLAGRYLIQVRAHDLAMTALQRAAEDAAAIGDTPLAAAAVTCQAWAMLRQGRFAEVENLCARTADTVEPRMSKATPDELAAWGWLLMRASSAAIRNNRSEEASEYLALAETAATRLGREHDLAGQYRFGPVTVALLHPENAMIEGRPDLALQALTRIPKGAGRTNPSSWNRASLERARALVRVGDLDKATEVLTRLRRQHGQWLRYQQAARDVTTELVQAHTRPLTPAQRDLVDFLNLTI
ncbi:hypothetical protein TBS_30900 [Thermobispora bispora]|uniref:helix-turn-helix domain-containing protein n=1 Tax=Thermobispora bispora TaxID=2006 RepID=UPI0030E7CEF1